MQKLFYPYKRIAQRYLNRSRQRIKQRKTPIWQNPLVIIGVVVLILCGFFYYISRDLWVSIEADVGKIKSGKDIAGILKIKTNQINVEQGKLSNLNSIIIRVGNSEEEEIGPGQLVISFPKRFGYHEIVFNDIVTVRNNEHNLYRFMYIIPNDTFEDREKKPYAIRLDAEEVEKPENFTRHYDGVIEIAQHQPGIQWEVLIDSEMRLQLPESSEILLKNRIIKAKEIGIRTLENKAKIKFDGGNIYFPEINELFYSGTANVISTFGGSTSLTLIKNGEPTKLNFTQGELGLSSKTEKYPLRVEIRKDGVGSLLKTNIWGPVGEVSVVGKSLLPGLPQILYSNFSSLSVAVLTTLLAWALSRLSR